MEGFYLIFVLELVLIRVCNGGTPPVIIEHPTDWIIDNSNFTLVRKIETTASLHNPSGVSKFTCKATGTPPITYRWFIFNSDQQRLPPPLTKNSTLSWSSGPVLIIKQKLSYYFIICEAVNTYGSTFSRRASLNTRSDWEINKMKNVSRVPFPLPIFSCGDTSTEDVINGRISYYTSGNMYKYTMYYSLDREILSRLDQAINTVNKSFAFSNGPFAVLGSERLKITAVYPLKTIQYICLKEWTAKYIVNTTFDKRLLPSLFPLEEITYPSLRKTIEFANGPITVSKVSLHLLYVSPPNAKPQRRYRVGDNIELICLVAIPSNITNISLTWMRADGPALTSDPTQRVHVERFYFGIKLKIRNISLADGGRYTCRANASTPTSSNAYVGLTLRPYQPVSFIGLRDDVPSVRIKDGMPLQLVCRFNASNETMNRVVAWLHNGRVLTRDVSVRGQTSVLNIRKANARRHNGMYQCEVQEDNDYTNGMFGSTSSMPSRRRREIVLHPSERIFALGYTIHTVAHVKVSAVNRYPPTIQSQLGDVITVGITGSGSPTTPPTGNRTITVLIITDKDQGSGGYIDNCKVTCTPVDGQCPQLYLQRLANDGNGSILVVELVMQYPLKLSTITTKVLCSDRGIPSLTSTLTLRIHLCNENEKVACKSTIKTSNSGLTQKLVRLATSNVTNMNTTSLKNYVNELAVAAKEVRNVTNVFDHNLATVSVDAVVNRLEKTPSEVSDVMQGMTDTLSNMTRVPTTVLREGEKQGGLVKRLLDNVDRITRLLPNGGRTWQTSELVLGSSVLQATSTGYILFDVNATDDRVESSIIRSASSPFSNATISIGVKTEAVLNDRVDFSMFANDSLFTALSPVEKEVNRSVLSSVVAARAVLNRQTVDPVQLIFNYDTLRPAEWKRLQCAFWNFSIDSWDTTGCRIVEVGNQSMVCLCTHLTNFALLMAVDRTAQPELSLAHSLALQILSIIVLIISSLSLGLTLIIYATFLYRETKAVRSGRKMSRASLTASQILISLCAALLAGHLTFLMGGHHQRNDAGCKVIGVLLHFCYLSAFAWSVVEGVNIFASLILLSLRKNQIQSRIPRFFLKASIGAWSIPAVIVIITLAINTDNYGTVMASSSSDNSTQNGGLCFLQPLPFYIAFLAPFLLCLVINLIILGLLAYVLHQQKQQKFTEQNYNWRRQMIGFLGICLLLNTTWILGTIQIGAAQLTLMYLFIIVNGAQGLLIFVCYCCLGKEMRQHMMRLFHLNSLRQALTSGPVSTTTGGPSTASTDPSRSGKKSIDMTSQGTVLSDKIGVKMTEIDLNEEVDASFENKAGSDNADTETFVSSANVAPGNTDNSAIQHEDCIECANDLDTIC